ncbi:hypothetical protein [Devosia chinhatensis]|uniref:Yip1 domain-containing protein n=1 Tax=Devosia chinhatensis TaxID=429727 RepID=A0A0F5FK47_9HYPH|nr:hypothetical protein [Devosia chinhatensis]KKB08572.1 hypothetical protein VE26_00245 [Devosia chinhatensis]
MKIGGLLLAALAGWQMILRGDPNWSSHFRLSAAGLASAVVLFYVFAVLAVVLASLQVGVPSLEGFFDIMLIQSLWLGALLIGLYGTRFAVRDKSPVFPVLVPGIHALTAYLVLGSLVSLILGMLLPLLWLALVFMLYRLGRVAAGWTHGVSAAFAFLTVVLLVGLPMTLYMLATTFAPPA